MEHKKKGRKKSFSYTIFNTFLWPWRSIGLLRSNCNVALQSLFFSIDTTRRQSLPIIAPCFFLLSLFNEWMNECVFFSPVGKHSFAWLICNHLFPFSFSPFGIVSLGTHFHSLRWNITAEPLFYRHAFDRRNWLIGRVLKCVTRMIG